MLKFFSKRHKGRAGQRLDANGLNGQNGAKYNKHVLPCKVQLLDGTDISVELPVSSHVHLLTFSCESAIW